MEGGCREDRHHMCRHSAGDSATHVLQHEGDIACGEETAAPYGCTNLLMPPHIHIPSSHQHLVGGFQWCLVAHDGQRDTLA